MPAHPHANVPDSFANSVAEKERKQSKPQPHNALLFRLASC